MSCQKVTTMRPQWIEGENYWKRGFTVCPDCGNAIFLRGPRGAESINFKCRGCGSAFNHMGPFGVERIPPQKAVTQRVTPP
jgi:predicted RNA-binding Zn-ribbon protein involved in translation (DUF1610 family)